MNKFRVLFIFGLGMITLPITMVIFAYIWHIGSNRVEKSFLQKDDKVIYDTIEVKKTVVDTIKIKVYEKVPQIDTKRVETQSLPIKDTLK
jgi:hypothetical protein